MQNRQRIVFLDWARVTACILVILYHTCSDTSFIYDPDLLGPLFVNESAHVWSSLYYLAGHIGVPLFFMISSWLLLPLDRNESAFGFYRHRFMRVIPPFLIFSLFYVFKSVIFGYNNFWEQAVLVKQIPLNYVHTHLWYMYVLIGLYLFMPVLSPWLRRATAREERFVIILFAISTFAEPLRYAKGYIWGEASWNEFNTLWYFTGYIGYVVIAHYIKVHLNWSARRRLVIGLSGTVVSFGILYAAYYYVMAPDTYHKYICKCIISYTSPLTVSLAVSLFLVFTGMRAVRIPRLFSEISRHSFGIYLLHRWIVYDVVVYLGFLLPASFAFKVPIAAGISLALSFLVIKAVSCLPYARFIVGSSTTLRKPKQLEITPESESLTQ